MNEIEDPDWAVATELIGGDASILSTLVEAFLEEVPELITGLNETLQARDSVEYCKIVHKLKSTIRIFGVPNSADLAETLEETTRDGDLTQADLHTAHITNQANHMIKLLNEFLANEKNE